MTLLKMFKSADDATINGSVGIRVSREILTDKLVSKGSAFRLICKLHDLLYIRTHQQSCLRKKVIWI